ncbi:MAG: outer membrane lipoprotein carrier protein LolA [Luteolibacter sp.]
MRLALTFIFAISSLASVRADNTALEAWLKRQPSINSLDTAFTQERKLPSLKNPTSANGRLSFMKPGKFRWQLGEPVETLAVSDGTTLTLVETAEKVAHQIPLDSPMAARFSLMSGKAFESQEAFQQTFEIIESRVTEGIHQYTLKARDRRMRSQVPWIFLDIDPVKNELRALELELQDKSRVRTIFHQPKINAALPDSLFKPDLTGLTIK